MHPQVGHGSEHRFDRQYMHVDTFHAEIQNLQSQVSRLEAKLASFEQMMALLKQNNDLINQLVKGTKYHHDSNDSASPSPSSSPSSLPVGPSPSSIARPVSGTRKIVGATPNNKQVANLQRWISTA